MPLDLSSLASVANFVAHFHSLNLPLNLLINNAGKFSHDHAISEDGFEMTFATNYLGHFLLTKLLVNKMAETAKATGVEGRIVNVSSSIHGWFSGDIIKYLAQISRNGRNYDATRAYALSKLANVLHTQELARRLKQMEANVTVNCVHPGIVRTRLTRDREGFITDLVFFMASKLLKTIPQAAATTCPLKSSMIGCQIMLFLERHVSFFSTGAVLTGSTFNGSVDPIRQLWLRSEIQNWISMVTVNI
ncbi:short-chain dehydrogenase TIC 32, chloroplastic-like [Momordica charantia]|uniref:Short-chain dehydrogenase TIC 32, chloroplastic-like n=1 Tax=Momordica charantia TaxID=3673 RepID=A0A6J1CVU0_MOMCH|nr:short-chain dehydrogenase TIC 32, chloroplastic-like [Momordica charantia]